MNVSLSNDLKDFVRTKVQSGEFPSEEAVLQAGLQKLREQEITSLEALVDQEFLELCSREVDDSVSLEEVLQATSKIPGSMAQTIIEEERSDRV